MPMTTFPDYDSDTPSLYPSSSPSSDSGDESYRVQSSDTGLRSYIASAPEFRLRSIMIKLAGSSPQFQRAISKELAHSDSDSSPITLINQRVRSRKNKARPSHRSLAVATHLPLFYQTESTSPPITPQAEKHVYHPGHLREEVYEFLSRTSDDVAFNVLRTVTMWSCCDEDERSPGCAAALSPAIPAGNLRCLDSGYELSHPDALPDSDLERRHEDSQSDTPYKILNLEHQ
ncbi:hypothetical protein CPB84DRAFT_1751678 [Gymnopilus junonius]|uniref:Uncharacterized protein n=1 Tax=Gymnopilus junonius TaxID=109634 RepID=A0A9P5NB02_GYMJU|nr:hypothetical protein CPB84DRAFT_1751678 [Gymnopilus junonius]